MGTIREVGVEYSRTVNLGNYESERLSVGLVESVDQGDAAETVARDLYTEAKAMVQGRLREAAEYRQLERQRGWAGGGPPKPRVDEEDDPTTGGL